MRIFKRKKILIIALAQSTHTYAWIDLINKNKFEVRLFGVDSSRPGVEIGSFYYSFWENFPFINQMPNQDRWLRISRKLLLRITRQTIHQLEMRWLNQIIKKWKPDIIHTLGIDPASIYFLMLQNKYKLKNVQYYRWIVTIRGGSDIELERFVLEKQKIFRRIFTKCDFVIADNKVTYSYAFQSGLNKNKKPAFEFVPGTGGMDIEKLSSLRKKKTSQSRIILWPKACEARYSKGLPVLEAIKKSWKDIAPCKIIMTVVDAEFIKWLNALPNEIRANIQVYDRIPRPKLLYFMAQSRVVLLPSLVDGIPNSLYEAMACKTFPIVSPLKTIRTIISTKNALFARNLYPNEIANALTKAMTDDIMVDKIVSNNLLLVKEIANRRKITNQINDFYDNL